MGSLKPGASYIYERADGVIYAREFGSSERKVIGWDSSANDSKSLRHHIEEDQLWQKIREAARSNPALQKALDQCIIIYNLSIEHGT